MSQQEDLIDKLVEEWRKERPELNPDPMHIVGRLIILGKNMENRASKILEDFNIGYSDFDVLATLRRSGEPYTLSPTELRESVLISSGAMTALLLRLEKAQLIHRSLNPHDGRIVMATLTKKGVDLIELAIKRRFEEAESHITNLNVSERMILTSLLKKLTLYLKN